MRKGKTFLPVAVLLTGIVLSFGLYLWIQVHEDEKRFSDFNLRATTRIGDILNSIEDNETALKSLAGFYASSQTVKREELKIFARSLLLRHPDIKALIWIPRILDSELEVYQDAASKAGFPDFKIKEFDSHKQLTDKTDRKEYFPAYYIEPLENNYVIFGVDFSTDPIHREAMNRAADSGLLSVTAKIRLIREEGRFGCKVFLPVYQKGVSLKTPEERRQNLTGFLAMLIDFKEMVDYTLKGKPLLSVDTYLYDDNASGDAHLLYYHMARTRVKKGEPVNDGDRKAGAGLIKSETIDAGGHTWRVLCRPAPEFFAAHKRWQPWIILGIGLLLTITLSYNLFLVSNRAAEVEALVAKRTEELKAREIQLGAIVSNVPGAIYRCANDAHWTMEFISSEIEHISGYPAGDFIKNKVRSYASIIHPDDVQMVDRAVQKAVKNEESYIIEYRILHSGGKIRWVFEKGQPIFIGNGALSWLDGVIFDVSERRKSEEQLRQLSRAVEQSPAVVIITDKEGKIEYVNPKFVQLTGYTLEETMGQNPRILKGETEPVEFYRQLWGTILAGNEWRGEFLNKKKNGELYWESASISPLKNARGEITHFVAVKEDITERKRLERIKDDFTSTVSHELRTPLAAMKEGIGIVLDGTAGEITPEQKEFLGLAKRNVDRLARLINDVLDFQKLDSGAMTFKIQDEDVNSVIRDVGQMMVLAAAKQKGLGLTFNLSENLPRIPFDRDKITQVLTNLINNAIKFTDKGSIKVTSSLGDHVVEVSVQDTGIGIKEEDLPKLFGKFTQLTSGSDRKTGGTGLGLAISKQIVEWHKGKIWAESKFGKGTTIHFFLPVKEQRA